MSALMVVLNATLYGKGVHAGLAGALAPLKPLVGGTPLLLLVPPCGAALGGLKLGGDCIWERTVAAAMIGGALVALLAGPLPGPYVDGFRDSDIVSHERAADHRGGDGALPDAVAAKLQPAQGSSARGHQ